MARTGEKRNECRILVGKHEGKGPRVSPRRRWEGNIKTGWEGVDLIRRVQDRD